MGRYDAYDDGYGDMAYSAEASKNSLVASSAGRGRSAVARDDGDGASRRSASRSQSRGADNRSVSSKKSGKSSASKMSRKNKKGSKLNLRSLGREESPAPSRRRDSKSKKKVFGNRRGSSSGGRGGSRPGTPSKASPGGNGWQENGVYDLEDEVYQQWSASLDEEQQQQQQMQVRQLPSNDDDDDEPHDVDGANKDEDSWDSQEASTAMPEDADNRTLFTRVSVQSFLPGAGMLLRGRGGGKVGPGGSAAVAPDNWLASPSAIPGSCLLDDLRNARSLWEWRFLLAQVLSGMTVCLQQVPECIGYAYVAGIDPFHALQSTWIANVITSVVGGRPGMVSGASGLGALAVRYVATSHGVEYAFCAALISGFLQVLFGALRIGNHLRLLPPGVTIGMVNALCLLLLALQVRYFRVLPGIDHGDSATELGAGGVSETEPTRLLSEGVDGDSLGMPWARFMGWDLPWTESMSQMVVVSSQAAFAVALCHLLPRHVVVVPSGLVAILILTLVNIIVRELSPFWVVPTVGDYLAVTSEVSFVDLPGSISLSLATGFQTHE